jgi:hypothetical protein
MDMYRKIDKIIRCEGKTKRGIRCRNHVKKTIVKPHPYCSKHLNNYFFKEFGRCLLCDELCNPASQCCKRCMGK